MIRTSPNTTRRAAAAILAAAVLPFLTSSAPAQQIVDLLGGTIGTPASLSTTTLTPAVPNTLFGPGYTGSLTSNVGLNNTLSEGFLANGTTNLYYVTQSGTALAGGTATASKLFGAILAANTTYSFTLTTSTAAGLSLLGNVNVALANGNPTTTVPFADASAGLGVGGLGINLLQLLNSSGSATFQFTTPATYNPANGIGVTFTSNLPVNGLNGSVVFNGASINQVPEPHTVVAMLLGASGLVVLRLRRRLAAV